jgi:hypothetical protein
MRWEYRLYSNIKAPKSTPIPPFGSLIGRFDAPIYKLYHILTKLRDMSIIQ